MFDQERIIKLVERVRAVCLVDATELEASSEVVAVVQKPGEPMRMHSLLQGGFEWSISQAMMVFKQALEIDSEAFFWEYFCDLKEEVETPDTELFKHFARIRGKVGKPGDSYFQDYYASRLTRTKIEAENFDAVRKAQNRVLHIRSVVNKLGDTFQRGCFLLFLTTFRHT